MKHLILLLALATFCFLPTLAQVARQPDGGGSYSFNNDIRDDITHQQRAAIIQMLKVNETQLRNEGKLNAVLNPALTLFQWPLRQAAGFTDNGYYGISNYIDHNSAYPNQILDYNCGNRTYDLASGYNHAGTDIFTWPFGWQKMAQNAVEIIAAAPGTIIAKSDGNSDQNCAFCTSCNWNAVYVMHADGSVAWYGHMKTSSLTAKAVGQTVTTGEYLGVVGSSGSSTGPHLHFEVYTNSSYTTLVDPWAGACNNMNGQTSWWATQQPYRVSTLNKIMTHSAPPGVGSCPSGEIPNSKVNFVNGETVYLASYYRDQLTGQTAVHTIYRPDNSVYNTWTQTFTTTYNASYYYYTQPLPNPAPTGIWRYTITYNSQTFTANFAVNTVLPLKLVNFNAVKKGGDVQLNFSTVNESNVSHFNVLRSPDGINYTAIDKVHAKNGLSNFYSITDKGVLKVNYYKLEMVDKDESKSYSETRQVIFSSVGNYITVTGNPFKNDLQLKIMQPVKNASIELIDIKGQIVYKQRYALITDGKISLPTPGLAPGVYQVILKNQTDILGRSTVIRQ